MSVFIYRAGDAGSLFPGEHASETREGATAYLDNPGFGGGTLARYEINPRNVLDSTSGLRPLARAWLDALRRLGEDPFDRAIEGIDARNPRKGVTPSDVEDHWRGLGYHYVFHVLENTPGRLGVHRVLSEDGEYDWVRFTDDFPPGSVTWLYLDPDGDSIDGEVIGTRQPRERTHAKAARESEDFPGASTRRARIRAAALEGAHGRRWYQDAEREIRTVARAWGVDPIYVAVAVAATSPATPVIASPRMSRGGGMSSNIGKARRVVKAHATSAPGSRVLNPESPGIGALKAFEACAAQGKPSPACLKVAFPKPNRVKTHSFVRNLLGYEDPVTVDRLVARTVAGGKDIKVTESRHFAVAEDIKVVAEELGWPPREVMAAVWTAAGGSGKLGLATTEERYIQDRGPKRRKEKNPQEEEKRGKGSSPSRNKRGS